MRTPRQLNEHGFSLYIDDFGTKSLSLSYLHKFRLDGLEIVRSFLHLMAKSVKRRDLVHITALIARNLGLRPFPEGFETALRRPPL
ncbi:MAG: EAL domain-containing protein [Myxococcota bacterium]